MCSDICIELQRPITGRPFFAKYWRKQPIVFRRACSPVVRMNWLWSVCKAPAVARLYSLERGSAKARELDPVENAREHVKAILEGRRCTVLLNQVDAVSTGLQKLREEIGVGRSWRYDDIVLTVSANGSGIGFHAGHEDGFIVQMAGRRVWRVWSKDVLPIVYQEFLLGSKRFGEVRPPNRPETLPILECELEVGDILYIPPLFAHEGTTVETSVSLSIAWAGITPLKILRHMNPGVAAKIDCGKGERRSRAFELLPDPPSRERFEQSAEAAVLRLLATPENKQPRRISI